LKATATFHFDRYVTGKVSSFDFFRSVDNNNIPLGRPPAPPTSSTRPRRVPVRGASGVVFRPMDLPTGTAIVQGELYADMVGERRTF
ncbi:MAG: hypothetical protein ACKO96_10430, partial [Flammeovirgaceae bacterium]